MAGDSSKLWEEIREVGAAIAAAVDRIKKLEKLVSGIPALFAPPDVTTQAGHAQLLGTLTKGTISGVQSQDALLYRVNVDGNWTSTGITVKIYDCGFICGPSLPVDTIIRWKAFGGKRYYDGGA